MPLFPRPLLPEPGGFPGGDSAEYRRLPCRDASHLRRPVGDFLLDLDLSFSHQRLEELLGHLKRTGSSKQFKYSLCGHCCDHLPAGDLLPALDVEDFF